MTAEPPTAIVPTGRCWRWHAQQPHDPHLTGSPPDTRRCPGFTDSTPDLQWHTSVISESIMLDEDKRRFHLRLARRTARMWGYLGRIQFARYPLRGPGLGHHAIEIRVHVARRKDTPC